MTWARWLGCSTSFASLWMVLPKRSSDLCGRPMRRVALTWQRLMPVNCASHVNNCTRPLAHSKWSEFPGFLRYSGRWRRQFRSMCFTLSNAVKMRSPKLNMPVLLPQNIWSDCWPENRFRRCLCFLSIGMFRNCYAQTGFIQPICGHLSGAGLICH